MFFPFVKQITVCIGPVRCIEIAWFTISSATWGAAKISSIFNLGHHQVNAIKSMHRIKQYHWVHFSTYAENTNHFKARGTTPAGDGVASGKTSVTLDVNQVNRPCLYQAQYRIFQWVKATSNNMILNNRYSYFGSIPVTIIPATCPWAYLAIG